MNIYTQCSLPSVYALNYESLDFLRGFVSTGSELKMEITSKILWKSLSIYYLKHCEWSHSASKVRSELHPGQWITRYHMNPDLSLVDSWKEGEL